MTTRERALTCVPAWHPEAAELYDRIEKAIREAEETARKRAARIASDQARRYTCKKMRGVCSAISRLIEENNG